MKVLLGFFSVAMVTMTCFLTCRTTSREPAPKELKQAGNWHLYTPPDRSFSVEVPCDPAQTNVSAASTPIYEYSCAGEEASGLSFFLVLVSNMPDAERARMRDEAAFERSIKDSFSPNKRLAKLIPLKIESGFGREFVVINTTSEMDNLRGKVIIFAGRRYEVAFGASDLKALGSSRAERFLSTFKPLE